MKGLGAAVKVGIFFAVILIASYMMFKRVHEGFRESDGYQFNLTSNSPKVFVVCTRDEVDDIPEPQLATLCQDEAVSYMEGEQEVFSVALHPSLIPWVEAFVKRYPPRPTHKRKRK